MADRQWVTIEVSDDVANRLREEAAAFGYESTSDVIEAALDALDHASSDNDEIEAILRRRAAVTLAAMRDGSERTYDIDEVEALLEQDHRDELATRR
jgi:Arc/MetJ-type ribon-helix-helix transcriptional regulator